MERADNLARDHTLVEYMKHNVMSNPAAREVEYKGASLDSRTIEPGEIFFPFKGANIDAYKFVIQAVCQAKSFAVVNHLIKQLGIDKQIVVHDTNKALQLLAAFLRADIEGKVVGVTGSAGKTTCKVMLAHILKGLKKKVYSSPRSFNTLSFGLPISLINCPGDVFAGVFEAGMSEPGTLDRMSGLMKPDVVIITSIQRAHIGNFNNEEEIAYEKMQLVNSAKEVVILPMCGYIKQMHEYATNKGLKVMVFGEQQEKDGIKADAVLLEATWKGKYSLCKANIMGELVEFKLAHPAKEAALSGVANLLLCKYWGLDLKACTNTLADFKPAEGRGQLKKVSMLSKEMTVYDESFNANFDSMVAALKAFANLEANEKVLILGQMNELGDLSKQMHQDLAEHVRSYKHIFLLGKEMRALHEKLKGEVEIKELHYVNNLLDLFSLLHDKAVYYPSGTAFFIKGSRSGVNLDKAVEFLENYDARRS